MNAYFLLALAIVSEVAGSSLLKAADGFKKLLPSIGVIIGYSVAFYALSLSLKTLPLGVAYAIWAGLGTVLTALVGIFIYKENVNGKKLLGLALIVCGVILLNSSGGH
ncbi:multidrug efflux SMR transporter [Cytobacillus firmus]|uniref:DMT family transporter n=1 Tax=Cytobacillus firmus TaxID=1399 RepID=UPI00384C1EAB